MADKQDKSVVFVGLSGGVDSSVAAFRLKQRGFMVVGVFIKVWQPPFLTCSAEADRLDAMRAAAALEIPFLTYDAAETYKRQVADYFIAEYKAGRTPNPDVVCNQAVKFGAFLDFALARGADFIATGHYARVDKENDSFHLRRGFDESKDQSYFLWTLNQEQLSHSLFPVGDSRKADIRGEARRAGLPTAAKKDSQGICFLGAVDIPDFLSHFVELKPGDVLDRAGRVIGRHESALIYTIGQRRGFSVLPSAAGVTPLYVVSRDVDKNTITVSPRKPQIEQSANLDLERVSWIGGVGQVGETYDIQTRYRGPLSQAEVVTVGDKKITLRLLEAGEAVSAGQSCVLYQGNDCRGGGIIA